MNINHLNEIQIQQYLFNQNECEGDIINHVNSCKMCSEKVADYRSLANQFQELPDPILKYDLSELVMAKITIVKEVKDKSSSLINIVIIVICVLTLLATIIFCLALSYLIENTNIQQSIYIVSSIVFISILYNVDQFISFNKTFKMLRT